MIKKIWGYMLMIAIALFCAINYTIFVFPNRFAPAGVDGICTMIQDVTNVSMGYPTLIVNIPLIIAAFLVLNREYAIKSALFVVSFSAWIIFLKHIDISEFCYVTSNGSSVVLAPIAAGTIRGILYAFTLKNNGSAGGVDIIASLIKKRKPYFNFMNIIFFFNMFIALCSYFVYGMNPEPVICSIIYSFLTTYTSNKIRFGKNESIKYEIITSDAESLRKDIAEKIHNSATIIDAKGAYLKTERKVVLCVVKKEKVPYIENLILNQKDCIVFKSVVSNSVSGIEYK